MLELITSISILNIVFIYVCTFDKSEAINLSNKIERLYH